MSDFPLQPDITHHDGRNAVALGHAAQAAQAAQLAYRDAMVTTQAAA